MAAASFGKAQRRQRYSGQPDGFQGLNKPGKQTRHTE